MQRVWYRKFDGCWYATFCEDGGQKQIKLLKGPNDKEHKKLATQKLIEELKVRKPSKRKGSRLAHCLRCPQGFSAPQQQNP
jgi:hypothetical protein